jgi:predicted DNA-binding transcriptional regulator YafY
VGRSDRLYALVEELRARAPRTVPRNELAERLEVSARTIERDILTLQQAGVPIWTQRGRFGGYAIEPATTLPPLNLEATEALAVMASLSVLPNHPFAGAGRRAQQKLLAAMRDSDVAKARELAARIRTEVPSHPPAAADVMRSIEGAVVERRVVELVYADRHGASTTRTVEAHGLHLTSRAGYLIGWCRLREAGRAFRLDRIEKAVISDEVAPERDLDPLLDWVEGATALDTGDRPPAPPTTTTTTFRPFWQRDLGDGTTHDLAVTTVRRLTADIDGVEEADHHGRPSWRLGRATLAAAQDGDRLWVEATPSDVSTLTTTSPDVFERHYGLTIRLDRVDPHELRRLVRTACRLAAIADRRPLLWPDVVDLAHERGVDLAAVADLHADGVTLELRLPAGDAAALVAADPFTFTRAPSGVLVDLDTVGAGRLAPLLARAADTSEGAPC